MEHTKHICNCGEEYCPHCAGGLFSCDVCGAAEGTLPTECPGTPISSEVQRMIYNKAVDYKDGRWVPGGRHGLPPYSVHPQNDSAPQRVKNFILTASREDRLTVLEALFGAAQLDEGVGMTEEALTSLVKAERAIEDAIGWMRAAVEER
jgi:hypothetical protein